MQKIIDKISKLLALAQSSNPNEAAAAAARAQALMEQYRVDAAMVAEAEEAPREEVDQECVEETARLATWKKALISALCGVNCCQVYISRGYRAMPATLYVVGTASNRATVQYLYRYLCVEIDRLAAMHKGNGRRWITSFRVGAASMIADRLREAHRKFAEDLRAKHQGDEVGLARAEKALVRIDQDRQRVDEWMSQLRLRKGHSSYRPSSDGYSQGREAGKSVSLGSNGPSLGSAARQLGAAK